VVGPSAKREVLTYLQSEYDVNQSLGCRTINLSRSTSYRTTVKDDSEVEKKLQKLAMEHPTRGFDNYYLRIRGEGLMWNRKRGLRVYRKLNLKMRRKSRKRINRPYKEALTQPILPNVMWSMDFMQDSLEDGRKVRILNILEDYNRECLSIRCGISIPSVRVIRILQEVIEIKGKPMRIRTDNGPEFISSAIHDWCTDEGIELLHIQLGKPNQNGYIERFNRTFREDILDAYLFDSYTQLQVICDEWKDKYNNGHPHQSLKGMTPIGFKYSRRKIIAAFEKVKAIQSESPKVDSALTFSTSAMLNAKDNINQNI